MPKLDGVTVEDGNVLLEGDCDICKLPYILVIPIDDWDGKKEPEEKTCLECAKNALIENQAATIESQKDVINKMNGLLLAAKIVARDLMDGK